MTILHSILAMTFGAVLLVAGPAHAERRVAFLVGNSEYIHTSPLENPVRDVALIGESLAALDFEVSSHENLTRAQIGQALSQFLQETEGADLTLFYFAGHGMQFENRNFLIGTDGRLASTFDIESEALDLDLVLRMLERNSRAAMVFIDACRNNPLAEDFYRSNYSETRALATRGLAPVQTAYQGTMITFSASPGQVAYDGGQNSPFATALAQHLGAENVEILSAMKRVIRDVRNLTDDRQVPMLLNDLTAEIYLNLSSDGDGASLAYQQEETMFEAALLMQSARAWDLYFQRFPDGYFRDMAVMERERLLSVQLAEESGVELPAQQDGQPVQLVISRETAEGAERALGLNRDDVRAIQEALNRLGYNAGVVDGLLGDGTRLAVANFQLASGLPSTGVVTAATAEALGVELSAAAESTTIPVMSSRDARRYDPDQLAQIEDDARLINAVRVLQDYELTYGFYEGRVYIAVNTWRERSWEDAVALAESAGGHLATITSPDEEALIWDLIRHDERLWTFWEDEFGRGAAGPTFGLFQQEGAREPAGGFAWVTGEPLDYQNWDDGQPNNWGGHEWVGSYMVYGPRGNRFGPLVWMPRWSDNNRASISLIIEIE